MYADCGVRPFTGTVTAGLDYPDALYYTTNYCGGTTLADVGQASWLRGRIPAKPYANLNRHRTGKVDGKINICF